MAWEERISLREQILISSPLPSRNFLWEGSGRDRVDKITGKDVFSAFWIYLVILVGLSLPFVLLDWPLGRDWWGWSS